MKQATTAKTIIFTVLCLLSGCAKDDVIVVHKKDKKALIEISGEKRVSITDSNNIVDITIYSGMEMIFSIGLKKGQREPDSVTRFVQSKGGDVYLLDYDENGKVERCVKVSEL